MAGVSNATNNDVDIFMNMLVEINLDPNVLEDIFFLNKIFFFFRELQATLQASFKQMAAVHDYTKFSTQVNGQVPRSLTRTTASTLSR